MLADSLSGSVDLVEGLGQFEHERLPIAARAVRQGRELGAYMLEQRDPKDEIETEHWREFHSTHAILSAYRVVRVPLLQPQQAGGLLGRTGHAYVGHAHRTSVVTDVSSSLDAVGKELGQRFAAVDPQCHTGQESVGHREQHGGGNVVRRSDPPRRIAGTDVFEIVTLAFCAK